MKLPRAKFCVSEVVRLLVEGNDLYDHSTAEITVMYYMVNQRIWVNLHHQVYYTGWAYKVNTSDGWVFEHQISKTKQPDTLGWFAQLMGQGNENTNKHWSNGRSNRGN